MNPSDKLKDTTAGGSDKIRYIDIIGEYGSNFTYRHQIDEIPTVSPYLYPSVFYHAKSGYWASLGAYRLINSYHDVNLSGAEINLPPSWIEGDINTGWDFKAGKNTNFSVSYMYSIYNREITFLKEALRNTFEGYAGHDFKIINSGVRFDYAYQNFTAKINGKPVKFNVQDYFASWENSHEWFIDDVFKSGDEFDIDPMFTIVAGTNNFIGEFVKQRFAGTKNAKKAADYAANANKFLIQQFTLSLPVAYTIGNFTFTPTFEYTILTQKQTETQPTTYPIFRFSTAYRFNFNK
jgi:hypothetical protein